MIYNKEKLLELSAASSAWRSGSGKQKLKKRRRRKLFR
mgnify:CR=1 FL=1